MEVCGAKVRGLAARGAERGLGGVVWWGEVGEEILVGCEFCERWGGERECLLGGWVYGHCERVRLRLKRVEVVVVATVFELWGSL